VNSRSVLYLPFIFLFAVIYPLAGSGCTCPPTDLSLAECAKYEIIFRGVIDKVNPCGERFGEAIFLVDELYKGNATREFKVLFECNDKCAQVFSAGEEWIIYSRYKQIDNAKMDWCSRSRKYFKIEAQDFYLVNYGNDYDDEIKFLREKLGNHRLLSRTHTEDHNRNKRPDTTQTIILLMSSIVAIVIFYLLFNRFFR
jgi:hypothetical protein